MMKATAWTILSTLSWTKKVQTYGVISTPAIGMKTTYLITPASTRKVRVTEDKYKEEIVI